MNYVQIVRSFLRPQEVQLSRHLVPRCRQTKVTSPRLVQLFFVVEVEQKYEIIAQSLS